MGTSLKVSPFNMAPNFINKERTICLLNMEEVGDFNFDSLNHKDIFIQGKIDDSILKIINDCGWNVKFFLLNLYLNSIKFNNIFF
jgi:hypothetical protein